MLLVMNMVAFFHAWKFTHFADTAEGRTKTPEQLSTAARIQTLFFGIDNPRPVNLRQPEQSFETVRLKSNKEIECWTIRRQQAKGWVILFHGYSGEKSSLLERSDEFLKLGYNTMLVDFMGSGGSEGNQTTIGFKEAQQVKTAFEYLVQSGENNIYLFGTSLGAVAILKSVSDYKLQPEGIILECPFGSMYETTCARFRAMKVPSFPMAGLLVFWGGVQNGFWAFGHNGTKYAEGVECPTLLLYGEKDIKVSSQETADIFANLRGDKVLKSYPHAGHESMFNDVKNEWVKDVNSFLEKHTEEH